MSLFFFENVIIDRDLSAHLPFGSYAEQAMHTKAPSRFIIVILIIAHNITIKKSYIL